MEISEVNPDGNVYQLKDSTARAGLAQIAAQNTYSTTEVDTGKKWIDGKSIYRRVFKKTVSYQANVETPIVPLSDVANVESIVNMSITMENTANETTFLPDRQTRVYFHKTSSVNGIIIDDNFPRDNIGFQIILEYTKA